MTEKIHEIDAPIRVWFWKRKKVREGLEEASAALERGKVSSLQIEYMEHRKWLYSTFFITVKGTLQSINALMRGLGR